MASSSSSSKQQKHQVFLSFRGEDTRYNFTSHLHEALKRKGIPYFIDYQLKRGEEISPALLTAIEESMVSIIVLSENYASSSWCLDELCKILECKKRNGQMVLPIFYHVNPSDVRKQTGSFATAFSEHDKKKSADKVKKWRTALVEVAGLAGDHLEVKKDRPESKLIMEIVEEISKKLMYTSLCDTKSLIGIDSRIQQIESLLCYGSEDVRIIGIWGMGGIGKTTIAKVVFSQFFAKFDGCCFLENVKGKYGQGHLQEELFSGILGDRNLNAGTSSLLTYTTDMLRDKKVLIVLDDVDDPMQLDLLPEKHCVGLGSRMIVTSRDKQVLRQVVFDEMMYEVQGLVADKALQLFSLYAFKQSHPKKDFIEVSKKVVHYAKGVPLALRVLGSHLYCRNKLFWKGELKKLKETPHSKINDILRISFDGLEDDELKDIFLDIACFLEGSDIYYVEDILDSCYNSVTTGIDILIDKSLITISNNCLWMHDLLQQMGRNIVLQESKEPGNRSRLWTPKDIRDVLKHNKGTEMVEGMFLDMSKIEELCLSSTAFASMCNLKLLKFYYSVDTSKRKVCLPEQGLEFLPDKLRLLHWDDYPSKSLPSNFCPENLVELMMPNSHIERLWNGVQNLAKLQWLDLSGSRHLIEIPDLSIATDLESINLDGCESLGEVPSSIKYLSKLKYLYLKDCKMIKRLPSSICSKLKSLEILDLYGCLRLESFPEIMETMGCLRELNLSVTSIEELPSSIEHLVGLTKLILDHCVRLKNLPGSIGKLESLYDLSLNHCSNITKIPEIPRNLGIIDLSGTAIVPSSIECGSQLEN